MERPGTYIERLELLENGEHKEEYGFPDKDVDDDYKEYEYCKKHLQSIYNKYLNNDDVSWSYSSVSYYDKLRMYGNGRQPEDYYKPFVNDGYARDDEGNINRSQHDDGGGTRTEKRKGWSQIIWDIMSVAPKLKSALIGKFSNAEYDIMADNIDPYSGAEKERKKYKAMLEVDFRDEISEIKDMIGIKETDSMPEIESREDVEMFDQMGGFKTAYASMMERLIKHTMNISDFREIKDRIVEDFIDLGVGSLIDDYDEEKNRVYTKWADLKRVIIQYSEKQDHSDSEWGGYVRHYKISELRRKGFDEEKLKSAARYFSGYGENPALGRWENIVNHGTDNYYPYDNHVVPVLDGYWIDLKNKQYEVRSNKYGDPTRRETKYGEEIDTSVNNNAKKKGMSVSVEKMNLRVLYRGKWIIDTDMMFDYGISHDMLRPEPKEVCPPLHVYKLRSKSVTEQLIPIYDVFQISWLKFQDAVARAKKAGYEINYDAIKNIQISGKNDPTEVMRRFAESGMMIAKYTNKEGHPNTQQRAITSIPGGMGEIFYELIQSFHFQLQMIEYITGITPTTLGVTPDPNQPVKTAELAAAGTDNTLRPMINGLHALKLNAAEHMVMQLQLMALDGRLKDSYNDVVGKEGIELLKMAEGKNVKYGIKLVARPTFAELQNIREDIRLGYEQGLLILPDKMDFDNMVSQGVPLKYISMQLYKRIEKRRKEKISESENIVRVQAEETRKTQEEGFKQNARETEREIEVEIAKIEADAKFKKENIVLEEEEKRKTLRVEYKEKRRLEQSKVVKTK